jgi:endonuclease YncB( thermonuclease family)
MYDRRILFQALLGLGCLLAGAAAGRELHSYAIVQDDGSLLISQTQVHLYGIYIPPTSRYCRTQIRPVRCASRAVLALDFKLQGFVSCEPRTVNSDGSLNAVCFVGRTQFDPGEDLGAYLIERGWALALPDAPFEYHALERIARHNSRGVWGFTVDEGSRR